METKLSKTQIATLEHICKKGWAVSADRLMNWKKWYRMVY